MKKLCVIQVFIHKIFKAQLYIILQVRRHMFDWKLKKSFTNFVLTLNIFLTITVFNCQMRKNISSKSNPSGAHFDKHYEQKEYIYHRSSDILQFKILELKLIFFYSN